MNLGSASTQRAASAETKVRSEAGTRLTGHWLLVARAVWATLVVLALAFYFANIPAYFASLHLLHAPNVQAFNGQLSPVDVHTLEAWGLSLDFYAICMVLVSLLFQFSYAGVGALLFWRRSDTRIALFTSFALMMLPFGFANLTLQALPLNWSWLIPALSALGNASLLLCAFVFPDGRFVPPWTRWLALVMLVYWAAVASFPSWGLDRSMLSLVLFFSFVLGTIVLQLYRYRYISTPQQRQQTKWAMFGVAIAVAGNILPRLLYYLVLFPLSGGSSLAYALEVSLIMGSMLAIPFTLGIAILRYRLWDIDVIINRTLVYGVLTVSVVALYILVVVGLGALLQAQGNLAISLLATGLVAVLFQPLRTRLQRTVNRLMYGERDDPYRVLTHLGSRLEATWAPEAVLPTIVETVALALKLPYVAITLKEEDTFIPAASSGAPREGESLVRLPLVAQHELVGELVLAPRAPGDAFTPADQRLLEDLTRQIGVAVYAVRLAADLKRLTVDLQRSRERLVTAREEERRRLRRDLHDGLGPQLASLTLKLETARNRLAHDPLADTLLSDLTTRTQATVADIRRLVYALRPPVLDELGLVSALGELTLQHSDQVAMRLDAPAGLPELPAAVEVAVYRIAQEALTNVVCHAAASHCDIRLALDEPAGWLSLAIQDDGGGLSPSHGVGVGLVSMRERAEELGGTWTIEQVESGGTRVLARLPLVLSETTDTLVAIPTGVPQEE